MRLTALRGYTAPDGREYAILGVSGGTGHSGGTSIIDLSHPPDTAWLATSCNYTRGTRTIATSHTVSIHDGYPCVNGCAQWSLI